MFFGSDGSNIHQIGNMTFQNGNNGNKFMSQAGNMSYRSDGTSFSQAGDMTFGSNGSSFSKAGNMYYGNNGTTYTLCGEMLISSSGKTWSGVKSDSDARRIIQMDM